MGCGFIPEPEAGLACQIPPGRAETEEAAERPEFIGKTPQQAAALADRQDEGIEVTWRYHYFTESGDSTSGYSECWCIPPPDGEVRAAQLTEFNQLLIMVQRDDRMIGGRQQPRLGWGCDAEPGTVPPPTGALLDHML